MIDIHCHLREPGFEYKETIKTGYRSAVSWGTTICPMSNTKPTPDSAIILQKILKEVKNMHLCNILPYFSVTKGEKAGELVNFEEMKNTGAINAGKIAEELKVDGVLPEAEEIMVAREVVISETNHAPHTKEEKHVEISKAPDGIIGFETAPYAEIMNLVDTGYLTYLHLVKLTSYNPAKILNIDRETIEVGKIADITIFNRNEEYIQMTKLYINQKIVHFLTKN